jgi:RNA polymerase sigma-70 factor (ECF subfamily)
MSKSLKQVCGRLRQPSDAEAWTRFVELYTPLLYRWSCRLGLQDADAADLVQDVFGILLGKLPQFDYDSRRGNSEHVAALARNR